MVLKSSLACFVVCLVVYTSKVMSDDSLEVQAKNYLEKYGYMKDSTTTMQEALVDFQSFAGIDVTGDMDDNTMKMMNTPRCGVKDRGGDADSATRRKRYAIQGSKWPVTDLTYNISKYPGTRLQERNQVDEEVARAFKVWSERTPLNFSPKKSGRVHIDIRFETKKHDDGDPFDGPGKTLAHAFFPQYGGAIHFDDEEKWTINVGKDIDLFLVAAHEIGHSLGLSHSEVRTALMAPFYKYVPNFKLDKDDVQGITAIYGSRSTSDVPQPGVTGRRARPRTDTENVPQPGVTGRRARPRTDTENVPQPGVTGRRARPRTENVPDLCASPEVDAVTKTADGSTYVFKGKHYWRITGSKIANGYPRLIQQDWGNLPADFDAVLTWSNGKSFFFKGDQYWRYTDRKGDSGYPKNIQNFFPGRQFRMESTLQWVGKGITHVFKGHKNWSSGDKQTLGRIDDFLRRRTYPRRNDEMKIEKQKAGSQRTRQLKYLVRCPKLNRGLHEITYVNKWVVTFPKN